MVQDVPGAASSEPAGDIRAALIRYLQGSREGIAKMGSDIGDAFTGMARQGLESHANFLEGRDPGTGKPLEAMTPYERANVAAHFVTGNMVGSIGAPTGAMGAGPVIRGMGARTRLTPAEDAMLDKLGFGEGMRPPAETLAERPPPSPARLERPSSGTAPAVDRRAQTYEGMPPPGQSSAVKAAAGKRLENTLAGIDASTGPLISDPTDVPLAQAMAPTGPNLAAARLAATKRGRVSLPAYLSDIQAQRGDKALPMAGARGVISTPSHIKTPEDFDALAGRYADLADAGRAGRNWYDQSGKAILAHTGDDPRMADAFAAALARTSPGTDVASNTAAAIRAHNQAMVGDPISTGRFPQAMGADLEKIYYGGQPVSGEKIGPFMSAVAKTWNPEAGEHSFVNDIWNMRAAEFPGEKPRGQLALPYADTPTSGEHNFARTLAQRAQDVMGDRGEPGWTPEQLQASVWTGIKSRSEGTSPDVAAKSFADALGANHAQMSWESAPGMTTGHLPEFHTADPAIRDEYHQAIRQAISDDQGRDLIARHLGFLTGQTVDGPGVFQGKVSPGSQSRVAAGTAPGGYLEGVDPATRDMLTAAEATRGLLLRQDAAAWHKPVFRDTLKPADANLADVRVGRPLTADEAQRAAAAMHEVSGSDFFSPITTEHGFRFMNVPEASGIDNPAFHQHVQNALERAELPDVDWRIGHADGDYIPNNWQEQQLGQGYVQRILGTGRPDLQRRAEELLSALGPRVSAVEEDFAQRHGWTPNRASRIWEHPDFGGAQAAPDQAVSVPSPPQPWSLRPSEAPGPAYLPQMAAPPPAFGLAATASP